MQPRILIISMFFLFQPFWAFAGITMLDKAIIKENIDIIEQSLENGEIDPVLSLISPNARESLKNEIADNLGGKKIRFRQDNISEWVILSPTRVKIKGGFSASGSGWKMNGFGDYFVFEKINGQWYILDTDFSQKMDPQYWWDFIKKIMTYAFPVFVITFSFWVWMLIDCLNRPIKDKLVWVLILVFLNILGALLYFFIERRKPVS